MSIATRELPASAIRVSAHCRHCQSDIETDGSNRCPDCGVETLPESRGKVRIVNLNAIDDGAPLPETGGASDPTPKRTGAEQRQPVLIRARKEAASWHAARAKLLAALEREEQAVVTRFEAARAELQQIRRERSAISQDIGLITIDGAAPSPSAAPPSPKSNVKRGRPLLDGRWSRTYEECRGPDHEGDDRKAIPHKSRGFCDRCYNTPAARQMREEEVNHDAN